MIESNTSNGIWVWWGIMVVVNIIQVIVAVRLYRQSKKSPDADSIYLKWMRIMGMVFTLVAIYRAVFVSRYLYQYAWFDTILNSSLIIRTFAFFAELSFAGLIGLAMLRFEQDLPAANGHSRLSKALSKSPYGIIISIFLAQPFAYIGLINKSRLAFAIEESLWGIGFIAILPLAIMQFRRIMTVDSNSTAKHLSMLKGFAIVNLTWAAIYCTYSLAFHLPTEYWSVALDQIRTGVPEVKTGLSAVYDAFRIVNVTHDPTDWGFGFFIWHSAYFSICVWISLYFMRAPRITN